MTVIRGRARGLTDACDGTAGEHAETIVQWCDDVTDVVERVRSVLETLIDPDDQTFEPVNLRRRSGPNSPASSGHIPT